MARVTYRHLKEKINGITINTGIKSSNKNFNLRTSRNVDYVVIHYTGNPKDTAKANCNYFASGSRGASAHFFVDDASIFQSVELKDVAWHCGTKKTYYHSTCRNSNSIGIELCCTAGNYKIGQKAKENGAYLAAALCKKLGITADKVDTYVLRHYDVTHKTCPAQMVNDLNEWKAFKEDVKRILTTGAISKEVATPKSFLVKITANVLNVRKGPGTSYAVATQVKKDEVYTIVEEQNGWGKLKSGAGWISLAYTEKV